MNKTILIAGGASVASLAAGATGGYFFAKKKLGKEFDTRLDKELETIKKHHAVQLMQAKENKPSLEELAKKIEEPARDDAGWLVRGENESDESYNNRVDAEYKEETLTDEEIAEAEQREVEGEKALVDYRGISTKAVQSTNESPADKARRLIGKTNPRPLPPRGDGGKFVKRDEGTPDGVEVVTDGPYVITQDDFLGNPFDYDQENLRYFAAEDTLLDYSNDVIMSSAVGEINLKNFVATNPEAGDILCVRHEAIGFDYEIQFMTEPLADYLGMTED
jgi:hypothetical protein